MRVMHSTFGNSCKNLSEAYIMYANEIANTSCPYSINELV